MVWCWRYQHSCKYGYFAANAKYPSLYVCSLPPLKQFLQKPFFSVSNEISQILVTRFLGNKWYNVPKRTCGSPSKRTNEKKKRRKKAMLTRAIRWVEFIYEYEFIYEFKDIKMNVVLTFWRHTPIFRPTLISG